MELEVEGGFFTDVCGFLIYKILQHPSKYCNQSFGSDYRFEDRAALNHFCFVINTFKLFSVATVYS